MSDLIFSPPKTKKALHQYLKTYINVNLSDNLVDPESTMSPMEGVWRIYQAMMTGEGPTSFVACAARNCGKTLLGSVITFLGMTLFRRHVVIMSATQNQSYQMIRYLDSSLRKTPELTPYFKSDSKSVKELIDLPKNSYTKISDYAVCVVAVNTMRGANSARGHVLLLDEVDQCTNSVLSEIAGVLDTTRDEHRLMPITVAFSSRKVPDGPLQERIDLSQRDPDECTLLKWSVADMLEPCPHKKENLTEEPTNACISMDTLEVKWDTNLSSLKPEEQDNWKERKQYKKCKTCIKGKTFKLCQGLSMDATPVNNSMMRRETRFAVKLLADVGDPVVLVAQYNNWKPESRGNVFNMLEERDHICSVDNAYRWALNIEDGIKTPQGMEWHDLARVLKTVGWEISCGIDFGYNPDPAVAVYIAYQRSTDKCIILKTFYEKMYADHEWAIYIMELSKKFNVRVDVYAPDTASGGAALSYFTKRGKRAVNKPTRIYDGVSQIRGLLKSPINGVRMKIVKEENDANFNLYLKEMKGWKKKKNDTTGEWHEDQFEDKNNHGCDATRYGLHPFIKNSKDKNNDSNSLDYQPLYVGNSLDLQLGLIQRARNADPHALTEIIQQEIQRQSGVSVNMIREEEDDDDNYGLLMI